jgi:hypothetical protein
MKKVIRLTESDLIKLVQRVINEQSGDYEKIKEFVQVFQPLGVMWTQNKLDDTASLSPSDEVGIGDRLSFVRKGRDGIKCKLKRDGNTIQCQDKNGITNFNLTNDIIKFKKWISNPNH